MNKADELLDEARPTCARCDKAGLNCGGYIRPVQFVDPQCRHLATQIQASELESKWEFVNQSLAVQLNVPVMTGHNSAIPREISFRAFQDNIYISFLGAQLFLHTSERKQTLGHWISALLGKNAVEPALSLATHSLATSFFGRVHLQPDIIARGAQLYVSALQAFLLLLSDPKRCLSYETLACANALELYEVGFLKSFVMWESSESLIWNHSLSLIPSAVDGYFMQVALNDW